jgi:hypothetical protein
MNFVRKPSYRAIGPEQASREPSGATRADRAAAFLNRGVEYAAKGELDRAIADYD